MAHERDFGKDDDLFVGDDISLEFEVFQDDLVVNDDGEYVSGTPQNVAGWALAFVLRNANNSSGDPVLSKTTGGSGITITGSYNASHASNTQRVVVAIADTDTFSDAGAIVIGPKTYRYSLKRTDAGSEKTLARGKFILQIEPARA